MSQQDALRQRLLQSHAEVLATVTNLDAAQAARAVNEGWSVQDLLAHLAAAELGHCQVIRRLQAGAPTAITDFELDTFNNAEVDAGRGRSLAEILAEYKENRAVTLRLLDMIGDEDWEKAGYHPGGFDTTVEGVFRVISIHEKRHLREFKSALRGIKK